MNLTFYHWGLHSWVVYVVVGLTLAYVSYRMGTSFGCLHPPSHETILLSRKASGGYQALTLLASGLHSLMRKK